MPRIASGPRTALAGLFVSAALADAIAFAASVDPEPCPACAEPENQGLCHAERCQRQVLPQIKEPSWYRDAGRKYFDEPAPAVPTHATDHAVRMAAQSERRLARLGRAAFRGEFTRTRRRRAA